MGHEFVVIMRLAVCCLVLASAAVADEPRFVWPNGARAAVSLAYDDALDSQLDHAIPALNRHGLKGSFYLTLSSTTLAQRMPEWRVAAGQGHELGNHSLFHQCSRRPAGRDWVLPENDLDQTSVAQLVAQIRVGNTMLHAIDGRSERSYTMPCGDLDAGGKPYLGKLRQDFIAIKSGHGAVVADMRTLDPYAVPVWVPVAVSGAQLIDAAQRAAASGTMVNFTFHGIGGDHLSVSSAAHEQLLAHLAEHRDIYWTDTFLNIMKHVKREQMR